MGAKTKVKIEEELGRLKYIISKLYEVKTIEGARALRDVGRSCVDKIARELEVDIKEVDLKVVLDESEKCKSCKLKGSGFDSAWMMEQIKDKFYTVSPYILEKACNEIADVLRGR